MIQALTAMQMKECDEETIHTIGIPSAVLMERASLAIAKEVLSFAEKQHISSSKLRVLSICGTGNNGGDGVAAARILFQKGIDARLFLTGNPGHRSEDLKEQLAIASNLGMRIAKRPDFTSCDIIIDAVFGIGLNKEVAGEYRKIIEKINDSDVPVIAADIPSGISADTGRVLGCAVSADATVTMQAVKRGLLLYPGALNAGVIIRADIGIREKVFKDILKIPVKSDLSLFPARDPSGNKGTFGKVLVIAGSHNMYGASYFTALSALRTGAGMVRVLTPESNRMILQETLPEAMLNTYNSKEEAISSLQSVLSWADVIACGPGLTTDDTAQALVETLLEITDKPVVLDADGLNSLKGNCSCLSSCRGLITVTPHVGEMSRLTGIPVSDIKADPVSCARNMAEKSGVVCVLKDARTVTAYPDGSVYLNIFGNDGMATAGSGDVLTGIISAVYASGASYKYAAALGVMIHGMAGDMAVEKRGRAGMLASDIIDGIQKVLGDNLKDETVQQNLRKN